MFDESTERYVSVNFCPLSLDAALWALDSPIVLTLRALTSGMARDWTSQLTQKIDQEGKRRERAEIRQEVDAENRRLLKKPARKKTTQMKRKAGSVMFR